MGTPTWSARPSSPTTSGLGPPVTPTSSRRSDAPPRWRPPPPGHAGPSPRRWRSRRTFAGAGPTRATARTRIGSPLWVPRWSRACRAAERMATPPGSTCWPAPSTSSPMVARPGAPPAAPSGPRGGSAPTATSAGVSTRAMPASTRPPCVRCICRRTRLPSPGASAASWRPTRPGTATRSMPTAGCSPTCSRASSGSTGSWSATTSPSTRSAPTTARRWSAA